MRWPIRMVALVVVLATNEARSDPAATMPPVPGSRLTPIYLAGEDESRQFVGWYDTARLESCSFAVSGDGVLRCLPTDAIEARLFTDAACTRRIAALSSCAIPKYLVEMRGQSVRH